MASGNSTLGVAEEWRFVRGDVYQVSNLGRVRRVRHVPNAKPPGMLNPNVKGPNPTLKYPKVSLGRKVQVLVHILVAEAFLGPKPLGMTVNHKNGNKRDPSADNLEYLTQGDNNKHAYRIGLKRHVQPIGEKNHAAKLTLEQARRVISLKGIDSQASIGRLFGISTTAVRLIHKGKNWSHANKG